MTTRALKDSEIIDYADHHSRNHGNAPGRDQPYKLGIELWRHVEERWNKAGSARSTMSANDLRARRAWDKKLGLGRQKIFEVRKHYNDVTFIDEFLTADFGGAEAVRLRLQREGEPLGDPRPRVPESEAQAAAAAHQLRGSRIIEVIDGNFENRGELCSRQPPRRRRPAHRLRQGHADESAGDVAAAVGIVTRVRRQGRLMRYDGRDHTDRKVEI